MALYSSRASQANSLPRYLTDERLYGQVMASTPSATRFYRPELDVVRFLAFALVFLHHTLPPASNPNIVHILKDFAPYLDVLTEACGFGLSLFFTLSAFLICELLLRERAAAGTVHVRQFYTRRILRIWPLYYLGLAMGLVWAYLPGHDHNGAFQMGWFAIFLGAWHAALRIGPAPANPFNSLWSISVEEQFYAFAPWITKYFSRKFIYAFCFALVFVTNSCLYYSGRTQVPNDKIWYNSLVQFECFAGGMLLCLILRGRLPTIAMPLRVTLLAGCGCCWFLASGLHTQFQYPFTNPGAWALIGEYALGLSGCLLILVAFLGLDAGLWPRWVIYLGRISFGLYVYHELALDIISASLPHAASLTSALASVKLSLAIGLNIAMAALSYRYLEAPFLRMKKRQSIIQSTL